MNPDTTPGESPPAVEPQRRDKAARRLATLLESSRERSGTRSEQMRSELRLPLATLLQIQSGDFEALGPELYAHGFVMSYARLVNAPLDEVETLWRELHATPEEIHLVSHVPQRPAWQQAVQRLATGVVAITVLVGPVLWLHSQGAFQEWFGQEEVAGVAAVDTGDPENAMMLADKTRGDPQPTPVLEVPEDPADPATAPVAASMARLPSGSAMSEAAGNVEAAPAPSAPLVMELYFRDDCWVEVSRGSGERLEYDLVRANSRRRYEGAGPFSVFLGNADAVTVAVNGEFLDISPWRQRNLARFEVTVPENADAE